MNEKIELSLCDVLSLSKTPGERVTSLFELMQDHGQSFYDESVTQLEHALQAAHLAKTSHATMEQITAALLHDIGHFLMDEHDEQNHFLAEDWQHETVGAQQLAPFFGKAVTEPIFLHVPAKRYLCSVNADYFNGLSRASQRSYELQGGLMTDAEIAEFEQNPFHHTAVLLRRWDDGAKVKGLKVPDLQEYHKEVESCLEHS
ncbi:HD domain-containing protein [Gimesia maris]|uniref:HD domain-containing protein n=1 Tax=Gimesia maris TaxID=122 RepID=UPI000E8E75E9|nr:HD domain-containing protein [Gimesia maris]HAW28018.1 HD family phosphohydrolase [Planctomycetaceae bacterium]|tara:strand:+ start:77300 stop:77905 length:606 start_codon:yes stop_codon:yes gene_type:complete